MYRVSFIILYYDQQIHNYFTNYHTPTCFDTIMSSSGSLYQFFAKLHKYFNSCFWNACVTWQGIDYKLPEDDTIVSKPVGCMIICEIIVHLLVTVQNATTCLRLWFRACLWFSHFWLPLHVIREPKIIRCDTLDFSVPYVSPV
jgi:hypothetical protein